MHLEAENGSGEEQRRLEIALAEYERAQELGHHTDSIIHEVTAIVWGANTLLLGFILEVDTKRYLQTPVIIASIVGLAMSLYVPITHSLAKRMQRIAYSICRKIEDDVPLPNRLNNQIHDNYPDWHPGLVAVWILTALFVVAWFIILVRACIYRFCGPL